MTTLNASDPTPVDPTLGADETSDAASCAAELLENGDIAAARQVLEDALITSPADPELWWAMADVEFADDNLLAAKGRLAEVGTMAGQNAETISRTIETLSGNYLWREALAAIDKLPDQLRGNVRVREAVGNYYRARGCHAHAVNSYGRRADLSAEAKSMRSRSWLLSGGPFAGIRRRVYELEESKFLAILRRDRQSSEQLNKLHGLTSGDVFELKTRIENSIYLWDYRQEASNAVFRLLMRLLPAAVLPVWLIMFTAAKTADFLVGPGGLVVGTLISSVISMGISILILRILVRSDLEPRLGIVLTPIRLYVLCGATVGAEFAVAVAYSHHILPASGWPAWIVFGCVAVPAIFALMMVCGMIIALSTWRIVNRVMRNNCKSILIDTLLQIMQRMQSSSWRYDMAMRLECAVGLEWTARRMKKDLIPAGFTNYVGAGDWLKQRTAGWAEALYRMQREIVAPNPGGHQKLESAIRQQILCLATGNLGALAWQQPALTPPRRVSFWRMAANAVRTVLVAGLPVVAVLASQSIWHFSAGEFRWAVIVTGVWGLLYVIICLDPTVSEKIETARRLAGTVHQARGIDRLG